MKNILFGIVVLSSLLTNAQHDNVWYFGNRAGIDFRSGSPVTLTDGVLNTMEGCSAMTDASGLLFYTDGVTVWNKEHTVMQNGTGLKGGPSSTQSAIVVPKPGQANIFYVFTVDGVGGTIGDKGLNYSEIDMEADGGLGAVINKNVQLITPTCEKLSATLHANGTDIWVVINRWGTNSFYSYLVTSAGVNTVPVISDAGQIFNTNPESQHDTGYMRVSPEGSHLVMVNNELNVQLFNFDTATGIVSNALTLKTSTDILYGAEFSPTGHFLYISTSRDILQYDVTAPNVAATEILILSTTIGMRALKLGPDSKIYFNNNFPITNTLSVINNPDVAGVGCNIQEGAIPLDGRRSSASLPSFVDSPFYLQDIIAAVDCTGSKFSFSVEATQSPEIITWDFGDGTTGEGTNVNHTYTNSGTYVVRATATRGIFRRYFTKSFTVTIVPPPAANQPQDMVLCDEGNDNSEIFLLSSQNMHIIGAQVPEDYTITYHADAEDAEAGINALPEDYQNISSPQTIYARVTDTATGCYATTSFAILIKPVPAIEMQDQYYICENNLIVLTAPAGFAAYLWSTGETTRTIFAAEGIYELTVTLQYDDLICEATKAIHVLKSGAPQIKDIIISDWTDTTNSITVVAQGVGNYEYSLDGVNYQPKPVFYNLLPGLYTVHVRDLNGCGIDEDDAVVLMYPRFFTPNSDGYNDFWRIKYANLEPEMLVYIYDRYGKLIHSFSGGSAGWDGTHNGSRLPSTDYWFFVKRKDGREHKGHFSMLR